MTTMEFPASNVSETHELQPCNRTSLEISNLGSDEFLPPCILYHIEPNISNSNTTLIRVVQVTPSACANHRDGAPTAIHRMNQDQGIAIGFNRDHYIKFEFLGVIGGNNQHLTKSEYDAQHTRILQQLLQQHSPHYIIGTCSFSAEIEKEVALESQTILLAQVGPPAFYENGANPYLFGFHVNSDTYPFPAAQSLKFHAEPLGIDRQPVRILHRTASEFFRSTCQAAYNFLEELEFRDLEIVSYHPDEDSDSNGLLNRDDPVFLQSLADQICPPNATDFHPAIFVCTLTEQDILLEQWRQNGCRPVSLWMTPSTWGWATQHPATVPFFAGGGQWHPNFDYSDDYFRSGVELIDTLEPQLGYRGDYNLVVSYSIATLLAKHIQARYRIQNTPNLTDDLSTDQGRELFRRDLLILKTSTLFGPFTLDDDQRNVGRGSAGTQWQSKQNNQHIPKDRSANRTTAPKTTIELENKCVSPFSQAESTNILPAPASVDCGPGAYVSLRAVREEPGLLTPKCRLCPPDTYTSTRNSLTACLPCPTGATTDGEVGSTTCVFYEDNILSRSLVAMSLIMVCIVWSLSLSIFFWIYRRKSRDILKFSTMFLGLLCLGSGISSLSILAISFHAGSGSESNAASLGCQTAPYLYCIGWILQAGSLAALSRPVDADKYPWIQYATHYFEKEALYPLGMAMLLDLIVLTCWRILAPVEYKRQTLDTTVDLDTGMITMVSAGTCAGSNNISVWFFLAPLIIIHVFLLAHTIILFWEHRHQSDRYKQRRHCFNAAVYGCQILLTGFPLLVAVHGNATATYLVMFGIIFANDLGLVSIVFFPIRSARKHCSEYQEKKNADEYESRRLKKERKKMLTEMKKGHKGPRSYFSSSGIESADPEDAESPPESSARSKAIGDYDVAHSNITDSPEGSFDERHPNGNRKLLLRASSSMTDMDQKPSPNFYGFQR